MLAVRGPLFWYLVSCEKRWVERCASSLFEGNGEAHCCRGLVGSHMAESKNMKPISDLELLIPWVASPGDKIWPSTSSHALSPFSGQRNFFSMHLMIIPAFCLFERLQTLQLTPTSSSTIHSTQTLRYTDVIHSMNIYKQPRQSI